MGMSVSSSGVKAEPNVVPMIDVMLVLLIIMMLIAPMLQQGVSLRLPTATNTVDKPESQDQTVISVAANKEIYLNAKPIREVDLAQKITDILEGKTEKIVLIKADEEVEYGAVMAVMDQLRQAAIEDVGLITEKRKDASGGAGGQ